jgi:iron complex transport system substrate-binding protein
MFDLKGYAGSMRIVSLLPGLTEICYALGLGHDLVAVTHECDYPAGAQLIPRITRSNLPGHLTTSADIDQHVRTALEVNQPLYDLDVDQLRRLEPDLILTQDLCHVCAVTADDVREIAASIDPVPDVVSTQPHSLKDMLETVNLIGQATGRAATASAVVTALQQRIDRISEQVNRIDHRSRVVCLEWLDPPMVAGHWVPEMVEIAGAVDQIGKPGEPSFEISWQDVVDADPDVIVLMPCGFDVTTAAEEVSRLGEKTAVIPPGIEQTTAAREGHVCVVDSSSYFSRPGPRLIAGIEILTGIFHAELNAGATPPGSVQPVQLLPTGIHR